MPRIQSYERQISAVGQIPNRQATASDVGGEGVSRLGASIQSAGQDLAFAQRQMQVASTQKAVSDVHVFLSNARSEYATRAEAAERAADPATAEYIGHDFLLGRSGEGDEGSLKWYLDNYRAQIQDPAALQTFDAGAAQLSGHFTEHFIGVQQRMAATYAKTQHIAMVDRAQNDVQRDPSLYKMVMNQTVAAIGDPNGIYSRLPADKREPLVLEAKQKIAESAVIGEIRMGPRLALNRLESGVWDHEIGGEQRVHLVNMAKTGIHAEEVALSQADAERNRQRIELARSSEAALIEKLAAHDQDPSKHKMVTPQDILNSNLAQLDPSKALTLVNLLHARSKENLDRPTHTNPVVMQNLFKRIHLPDSDPKKLIDTDEVYAAYASGSLKFEDMNHLRREIVEARTPEGSIFGREKAEFFKRVEPQITKPGPFGIYTDPTTPEQFYRFQQDVEEAVSQYRKLGKDPRELFDPANKSYFGRPEFLRKYQNDSFRSLSMPSAPAASVPAQTGVQSKPRKSLDEIFKK